MSDDAIDESAGAMTDYDLLEDSLDRYWSAIVAYKHDYRCLVCGLAGSDAHHWLYGRSIKKYRWCDKNGVYLCRRCHNQVHSGGKFDLKIILIQTKPEIIKWAKSLPPLKTEPITKTGLIFLCNSMRNYMSQQGIRKGVM